jgi:hypothetical protein
MNGIRQIIWPMTILLIAMIGAATYLTVKGHSDDVRTATILVAQGVGFLLNFWVSRRTAQPTEQKLDELASQPPNDDLVEQHRSLADRLSRIETMVTKTDHKIDGAIGASP